MPKYLVRIDKHVVQSTTIEVTAKNEAEAVKKGKAAIPEHAHLMIDMSDVPGTEAAEVIEKVDE